MKTPTNPTTQHMIETHLSTQTHQNRHMKTHSIDVLARDYVMLRIEWTYNTVTQGTVLPKPVHLGQTPGHCQGSGILSSGPWGHPCPTPGPLIRPPQYCSWIHVRQLKNNLVVCFHSNYLRYSLLSFSKMQITGLPIQFKNKYLHWKTEYIKRFDVCDLSKLGSKSSEKKTGLILSNIKTVLEMFLNGKSAKLVYFSEQINNPNHLPSQWRLSLRRIKLFFFVQNSKEAD